MRWFRRTVRVAVYRQDARQWVVVRVDRGCLGDRDAEMAEIIEQWNRSGDPDPPADLRWPVLVVDDPRGRFGYGCSTNSHLDALEWDSLDEHVDCAHGITMDRILRTARRGERW